MNFYFYLKLYLLTVPVFFLIDLLWLGIIAKDFYQKYLNHLLANSVNWVAAGVFYLLYIGFILFFAVVPALKEGNWTKALFLGAAFGFITYATYDLTNLATLKEWPLIVVIGDIAWGTVLGASVATCSFYIGKYLGA